ncbi:hypothetical protein H6F44_21160 [Pseudanabaena sp. FACHB-1277]|uniref:Uncharacterized protein n=1 Tax=Pseudanabaena cinerea FACHB-1277 TaxID=2949581 RepID=A0A926UXA0_9CYAN|nr:hypothetical protein [Pseudanabaena cinerea]MBD2152608.1 hypothetical protein [Pseudanabaena cinerea FACHB-1277]
MINELKKNCAIALVALSLGIIAGYFVSESLSKPNTAIATNTAPATTAPAAPKLSRAELEQRYIKAVVKQGFRVDETNLNALTDKQLNDEVARLEAISNPKVTNSN